jgi:rhodanese-related sulfurtransferase
MRLLKRSLTVITPVIFVLSCSAAGGAGKAEIAIDRVKELISDSSDVVLLDVRTEAEYEGDTGHLPGAVLIPVQELENRLAELEPYRDRMIIVYCRSGNRSGKGTGILNEEGFRAFNMTGGMIAWNQKYGIPDNDESEK